MLGRRVTTRTAKESHVVDMEAHVQDLTKIAADGPTAYIPLEVAKRRVGELASSLTAMKRHHLEVLEQVTATYEALNTENRKVFQATLDTVKRKATIAVEGHQESSHKLAEQKKELQAQQTTLTAEVAALKKQIETVANGPRVQELEGTLAANAARIQELEALLKAARAQGGKGSGGVGAPSMTPAAASSAGEVEVARRELATAETALKQDLEEQRRADAELEKVRGPMAATLVEFGINDLGNEEWEELRRMLAFYPNNTKLVEDVKKVTAFHEEKKAELGELKKGLDALLPDAPERAATEFELLKGELAANKEKHRAAKARLQDGENERKGLVTRFKLDQLKGAAGVERKFTPEDRKRLGDVARVRIETQAVADLAVVVEGKLKQSKAKVVAAQARVAALAGGGAGAVAGAVGFPTIVADPAVAARLRAKEIEVADLGRRLEAKQGEIVGLKRDLEALTSVGSDPDAKAKLLSDQLAALRAEAEAKSGEIAQLQKDLETTQQQLAQGGGDSSGSGGSTSDAEVASLRATVASVEETVRSRDEEIGSLKRAMASSEVPELTNTDIQRLKSEHEGLNKTKTQLTGDLGTAQTALARATAQLTELQKTSASMMKDATAHAAAVEAKLTQEFGAKISGLESRQKALEEELGTKTDEAARLTTELAAVTGERDGLLVELEDMKVKVAKTVVLEATLADKEALLTTTQEQVEALTEDVASKDKSLEESAVKMNNEIKRRKEFQFKYEEAKGKVRVYSRVRPLSKMEIETKERLCTREGPNAWTIELNETTKDLMGNVMDKWRPFVFDAIFQAGINGTQTEIFEECSMFGDMAVGGVNACIFAYGQSGTGKTFTMAGVPGHAELKGLKPRMIDHVFAQCAEDKNIECTISCYMVEIYLNKLEDLMWKLDTFKKYKGKKATEWPEPPELKVRSDKKRKVVIENVQMATFETPQQMHDYTDAAERMRRVRKTGLNDESSRSHLIFALSVTATDKKTGKTTNGKISLVDLAGSERADKTNVEGLSQKERAQMLEEGTAINESLRMLKNVFRVLGMPPPKDSKKGQKELVQYRGNMLTELMQDSLGGNARTLMFVNVGPAASNTSESMDSLSYGDLVKNITNEVAAEDEDYLEQIRYLKDRILEYKTKLGITD